MRLRLQHTEKNRNGVKVRKYALSGECNREGVKEKQSVGNFD